MTKPLCSEYRPVLLGGSTPRGRQRVVESYDGWIPSGLNAQQLADGIADLERRAYELLAAP